MIIARLLFCCLLFASMAVAADGGGTAIVRLHGQLPLTSAPSLMAPMSTELTLHEACEMLRKAFRGGETRVVVDLSVDFRPGLAAAEELAATIADAPEGVSVACLVENVDDPAMVVAAACDEVVAAEAGLLFVDGIALAVDHYTGLLDKLGITVHAVTSGPEKIAPEPFTLPAPSEAAKAEYARLLAAMDAALVADTLGEDFDQEALRAARAAAPQTGPAAAELGLVDAAVEPGAWLADQPEPQRVITAGGPMPDLSTFAGAMAFWSQLLAGEQGPRHPAAVAVVHLEGMIVDGEGPLVGGTIYGHSAARLIDDLADDSRIKAVVVRIDSGGGSASASDRIFQALRRVDAVKPVVALLDGAAASGGYYIAIGAREILAHRGTITGSIGVFAMMPDLTTMRDQLGITRHTLRSDPRAGLFSTDAMTPERRAAVQTLIDATDDRFQSLVAERRGLDRATVAGLADGKVYLGAEAVQLGLVDGIATLPAAVRAARAHAGEADPLPLELYPKADGLAAMLGLGPAALAPRALGPLRAVTMPLRQGRPLVMAWSPVPEQH